VDVADEEVPSVVEEDGVEEVDFYLPRNLFQSIVGSERISGFPWANNYANC